MCDQQVSGFSVGFCSNRCKRWTILFTSFTPIHLVETSVLVTFRNRIRKMMDDTKISVGSQGGWYTGTVFPRIVSANTINFSCLPHSNTANTEALAHADYTHGAQFFSVWSSSLSRSSERLVAKPLSLPAIFSGYLLKHVSYT